MDSGAIVYWIIGLTVLLPLGARIAGNDRLARRLDLLPRFVFGLALLVIAFRPASTFRIGSHYAPESFEPLSGKAGRTFFALFGLVLVGGGIRILIRKDYDRPGQDD